MSVPVNVWGSYCSVCWVPRKGRTRQVRSIDQHDTEEMSAVCRDWHGRFGPGFDIKLRKESAQNKAQRRPN